MYRPDARNERQQLFGTPSKRQKYDNYTPRKRYMKEQEQYASYQYGSNNNCSNPTSPKEQENIPSCSKIRNLSSSRREYVEKPDEYRSKGGNSFQYRETFGSNPPEIFADYTANTSNMLSLRKQKLKKNFDQKDVSKRLSFGEQNKDVSNLTFRPKNYKIVQDEPLTPRKLRRRQQQTEGVLADKMSALQNKISRLERLTPKKPSMSRVSRIIQGVMSESVQRYVQKEQPKNESQMSSRVSVVSQRESQLLSRVNLGRLVQEEECQSEIEVIQDLSYKISCKLQSIIRNFG